MSSRGRRGSAETLTTDWTTVEVDPATATYPVAARFGEKSIWVFRSPQGMFAVQDTCPHAEESLGVAELVGTRGMLRCNYHNYTFRLSDGRGVNCPGFAIEVYDVKEEDGALFVRPRT